MVGHALKLLSTDGTSAAAEFLDQQGYPLDVARTYSELVKHLYWQDKNIPSMIAMALAGMGYTMISAKSIMPRDVATARALRSEAKTMAYNLASFTWIGWDEPGITLSQSDRRHGLEAARINLRLAFELNKGDLRISRGYWIKAAQLLATGSLQAAEYGFDKAAIYAFRAGAQADRLSGQAFALLAALLRNPGSPALEGQLELIKVQLRVLEHGDMFVQQVETAGRVFGLSTSA